MPEKAPITSANIYEQQVDLSRISAESKLAHLATRFPVGEIRTVRAVLTDERDGWVAERVREAFNGRVNQKGRQVQMGAYDLIVTVEDGVYNQQSFDAGLNRVIGMRAATFREIGELQEKLDTSDSSLTDEQKKSLETRLQSFVEQLDVLMILENWMKQVQEMAKSKRQAKPAMTEAASAVVMPPAGGEPTVTQTVDAAAVEAANPVVSRSENLVNLEAQIRNKIKELDENPPLVVQRVDDVIDKELNPIYKNLERIRTGIPVEEYKALELDVLFCDYRTTKRTLNHKLASDEGDSKNRDFYFKDVFDQIFAGQRGFGRLTRLIYKVKENTENTDPALLSDMENDAKRFEKEIRLRRMAYFAEQELEAFVWGVGDAGKPAARTYPQQAPEVMIGQADIPALLLKSGELSPDTRLRFHEETVYNRELPAKRLSMVDFEHPDIPQEVEFKPTVHGEVMRYLDLLYSDKLHDKYAAAKERFVAAGLMDKYVALLAKLSNLTGPLTPEQKAKLIEDDDRYIEQLSGFYKTMHVSTTKYQIPAIIRRAMMVISSTIDNAIPAAPEMAEGIDISELEIKQAWLPHVLFCNQSALIPGSSPNTNDMIFKGNQPGTYVGSGSKGNIRTTATEVVTIYGLFRAYDPRVKGSPNVTATHNEAKDIPGKNYLFGRGGVGSVDRARLPKPKGFTQWLGAKLTPLPPENGKTFREKMREELLADPRTREYVYLAELPLQLLPKSVFGTHVVIPTPLEYMLITNRKPAARSLKPGEKNVLRWAEQDPDVVPPPVTAADWVSVDREILYEMVPWGDVLASQEIEKWYNNGKNITRLYELIYGAPSADVLDTSKLPAEQNDIKYATSFFGPYGLEAAAGRFDSKALFNRITITRVFLTCIALLINDKLQLSEIHKKLIYLGDTLKPEAIEAIAKALNVTFGAIENSEELKKLAQEQFVSLLRFQK